ncbi:MAG: hypothetical protein JXR83_19295 [Deltaproteobacteria bacterium]|nr:hypothetical protein [Deltaproteobacteria bacterium]
MSERDGAGAGPTDDLKKARPIAGGIDRAGDDEAATASRDAEEPVDKDGDESTNEGPRRPRLINKTMVGVIFYRGDIPRDFDSIGLTLQPGDRLLVEHSHGPRLGTVMIPPRAMQVDARRLRRVIRRVSDERAYLEEIAKRSREAIEFCQQCIRQYQLPMKLVDVEFGVAGSRCTFYFVSEQRVDFRMLVRDLARRLRTRIEMRQIGVRDQSRLCGGIGVCGRELCCNSWIGRFAPVSIRMAKDQGLALNPQKVSGVCGRLLCCLTYEEEAYRELRQGLPKIGKRVITPLGEGRVKDVDVLAGRIRVLLEQGLKEFHRDEIRPLSAVPGVDGASPEAAPLHRQRAGSTRRAREVDDELEEGADGEADAEEEPASSAQTAAPQIAASAPQTPGQADGAQRTRPRRRRRRRRRDPGPGSPPPAPAVQ